MENNYFGKGFKALEKDEKLNGLIGSIKENNGENDVLMGYLLGFQKALQENDNNLEAFKKVESKVLTKRLDNIHYLSEYLKKNEDDDYIKCKIVKEISELVIYLNETNESEVK